VDHRSGPAPTDPAPSQDDPAAGLGGSRPGRPTRGSRGPERDPPSSPIPAYQPEAPARNPSRAEDPQTGSQRRSQARRSVGPRAQLSHPYPAAPYPHAEGPPGTPVGTLNHAGDSGDASGPPAGRGSETVSAPTTRPTLSPDPTERDNGSSMEPTHDPAPERRDRSPEAAPFAPRPDSTEHPP
jgi:hypothetical protein